MITFSNVTLEIPPSNVSKASDSISYYLTQCFLNFLDFLNCFGFWGPYCTAVWSRNLEWEQLNRKLLLTLFWHEIYHVFLDCSMTLGYVVGTWWSPSKYWWWLLVISTPLPNCGCHAVKICHFADVMRRQKHIIGQISCTKMQFKQGSN